MDSILSKGSYFKAVGYILQITEYRDQASIDDSKSITNTNKQELENNMNANQNYLKIDKHRIRIKNIPNIDKDYLELYLNFLAGENEISTYEIRPNENCVIVTFTKEIVFEKILQRHAKKSKLMNKSTEVLQVYETEFNPTKPIPYNTNTNTCVSSKHSYEKEGQAEAFTNKLYTEFHHYENTIPYSHLDSKNYQAQSMQTTNSNAKKIVVNTHYSIPKPNVNPNLNYYSMSANNSDIKNNYDSKSIKSNFESRKTDSNPVTDKTNKLNYLKQDIHKPATNYVQALVNQNQNMQRLDMKIKVKSDNEKSVEAKQKLSSSSSTLNVNKKSTELNLKSSVNLPTLDQPYKILNNAFKNIFKSDQIYHEEKYLQTEIIKKSEYPISFINNIPVYQLDKNDTIKQIQLPNDLGRSSRNQAKIVRIHGAPPPKLTKLEPNSTQPKTDLHVQNNLRFSISDYHRHEMDPINSNNQYIPNPTHQTKARARSSNPTQNNILSQYGAVTRSEAINRLDKNQIEFFKTSNYLSNLKAKYPNLSINLNETLKQLYFFGSPAKIFEAKKQVLADLGSFRYYEYKLEKNEIISFLDRIETKQRICLLVNAQLKLNNKSPLDFCAYDIKTFEYVYNSNVQYNGNISLIIFSNSIENADYLYKHIIEIVQSVR